MWKPRIKKTKDDLFFELNQVLLKSGIIKEQIDFDYKNHTEVISEVYELAKILEFKLYFKNRKICGIYLRQIYTCCEKLSRIEKKEILDFKGKIPVKKKN